MNRANKKYLPAEKRKIFDHISRGLKEGKSVAESSRELQKELGRTSWAIAQRFYQLRRQGKFGEVEGAMEDGAEDKLVAAMANLLEAVIAYVGERGKELAQRVGELTAENKKLKEQVDKLRKENNDETIQDRGWIKKLQNAWERG